MCVHSSVPGFNIPVPGKDFNFFIIKINVINDTFNTLILQYSMVVF